MPALNRAIGRRTWVIPEGYIPENSIGPEPAMTSHETVCLLNTSDRTAGVAITVYFPDREPVGPYRLEIPPRRTRHGPVQRPRRPGAGCRRGTDDASVIISDVAPGRRSTPASTADRPRTR